MSEGGIKQVAVGLIRIKCRDCKNEFIARLDVHCHEAESRDYVANSYCVGCEEKNPLRKLEVRTLRPALVETQRIDPDCFEANQSIEATDDSTGGSNDAE